MRDVYDIHIHWAPRHTGSNFEPNERVDDLTKKAAVGEHSLMKDLPPSLCKSIPKSLAVICQELTAKIQCTWLHCWKNPPQMHQLSSIDNSTPFKRWMKLVDPLTCKQAAILRHLRLGHIGLNKHLHQI